MKGIGVSPGIAIGKAFIVKRSEHVMTGFLLRSEANVLSEMEKFDEAVRTSIAEVEAIITNGKLRLLSEEIAILDTQIKFLRDPQIRTDVLDLIQNNLATAQDSLTLVVRRLVEIHPNLADGYTGIRSADIQDIGNRLLRHLNNTAQSASHRLERDTIIIAEDISPSDAITMDMKNVIGFATCAGSRTSHTAILAKAKGLPAVVGCGDQLRLVRNNDTIILDGRSGHLLINPDTKSLEEYKRLRNDHLRMTEALKSLMDLPAVTADGTEIRMLGNISHADDLEDVFDNGGQGSGLFRTEMFFLGQNAHPDEEEQFLFYRDVAERSNNTPVVVRTIDIGGDRQPDYFDLPAERNPFLGYRAIRISLDRPEIFLTQLKAILRASAFGNLRIMFPMISSITELRKAKGLLEQAKNELSDKRIEFDKDIEVGIMIEVPSAAMMADMFAREVDFFSIGTNDLCQYAVAADRMNEKMEHLYDPFNPGVLRLISYVIEQANRYNIQVGICGEMASDPLAVPLLLGLGLKELSMNAGSISAVKEVILNITMRQAKEIADRVMQMETSGEIVRYLREVGG